MDLPQSLQRLAVEVDGWLDLGCPDQALRRMRPLLDTAATRPMGMALQARALIELERYQLALSTIQKLRETEHDAEWLDIQEAWCRKRTDDLPGAIECMRRLIAREPRSAIGHYNLGCYLALSGEHDRAIDEVTIACGMDESFRRHAALESDLDSLRGDTRFDLLIKSG